MNRPMEDVISVEEGVDMDEEEGVVVEEEVEVVEEVDETLLLNILALLLNRELS